MLEGFFAFFRRAQKYLQMLFDLLLPDIVGEGLRPQGEINLAVLWLFLGRDFPLFFFGGFTNHSGFILAFRDFVCRRVIFRSIGPTYTKTRYGSYPRDHGC